MYLIGTPNFQRQHYLYWCNVYNLSHGITGHHHSSSGTKVMKKIWKIRTKNKIFFDAIIDSIAQRIWDYKAASTAANKKCHQWDVRQVLPISGIFAER